ncbi:MAG: DUF6494 family protein [Methyloceanibacter sp.]
MEKFNISMRKYLKEVGVTSQQAIERVVREEKLAGKGKLKVKMVLTRRRHQPKACGRRRDRPV